MGGVKKRSGGKGKTINTTRYGRKFKKMYQKDRYTVKMSNIREKWNKKLSLKCNMKRLGLVYDINSDIGPFEKSEKMEHLSSVEATNIEPMDTIDHSITSDISGLEEKKKPKQRKRKYKKASELMEEFQVRASRPERQRCHLSTAEAEYAANLLTLYGTDYKKMMVAKENYDQLTEIQLRKKCEQLLGSREARHLKLFRELGLIT